MTRDGAVSENLATGEVERISSREPETELASSPEESGNAALDLTARAAKHREAKHSKKQAKADKKAVRQGSAVRRRPSSRLQFSDEERADPMLKKPITRSDRAADKLGAAKDASRKSVFSAKSALSMRLPAKAKQDCILRKQRKSRTASCTTIRSPVLCRS